MIKCPEVVSSPTYLTSQGFLWMDPAGDKLQVWSGGPAAILISTSLAAFSADTELLSRRYAINDASADWSAAEAQVANLAQGGKSTVVSVKSAVVAGQKRKAAADPETGAGVEKRGGGGGEKEKKSRRSVKKAKR